MSSSFRRASRPRQNVTNNNNTSTSKTTKITPILSTVLERVGTKPSKGGLTLTSTGLRELDAIIGGGQPLGTAMLIEEDRWTQDLALALTRYWSAEGVAQEQNLSLIATAPDIDISNLSLLSEMQDAYDENQANHFNIQQHGMNSTALQTFISLLPRNLHLDKFRNKMKDADSKSDVSTSTISESTHNSLLSGTTSSIAEQGNFTIMEENDDFDEEAEIDGTATTEEKGDEMLQNAWQYKVSVQRERRAEHLVSSSQRSSSQRSSSKNGNKLYCHSYDLSGKMEDQHDDDTSWRDKSSRISILDCYCKDFSVLCCQGYTKSGIDFYRKCLLHIHETISRYPSGVVRMLLMNAPMNITAMALPLLLSYIRTHSLPVVILVTVRPWIQSSTKSKSIQSLISLRRTCDAVFTCEGFDAIVTPPPAEFSDLAGIFSIRKMALQSQAHFADSTTNRRPPANRFGMKRDRRKLHISMLHLPPEDFSAGGSSVGSGVRSGGGRPAQEQGGSSKTALQPGMGCATNMPGKSSSKSLDF